MLTFYIVLMIGGGNDIIAYNFDLSFNTMIRVLQVLLFVGPVVAFIVAKRMALSLQRRDRDLLLHGRETGRVLRLPSGEFLEIHEPVDEEYRAKILSKTDVEPLALPEVVDENGVAQSCGAQAEAQVALVALLLRRQRAAAHRRGAGRGAGAHRPRAARGGRVRLRCRGGDRRAPALISDDARAARPGVAGAGVALQDRVPWLSD